MTAEAVGFAMEQLLEAGAKEVYTIPAGMKKSRPGIVLKVLCAAADRDTLLPLIFRHTTTIGVREIPVRRYALERKEYVFQTPYGPLRRKSSTGYGVSRDKYEYEDLARMAREQRISLEEVRHLLHQSRKSDADS